MTEQTSPKSHYNAFTLWVKDFERSRLGGIAIDVLKAIYGNSTPTLQKRLKEEVLHACYYAFLFWHWGDVNSEKRDLLRDIANLDDALHDKIVSVAHEISFFRSIYDVIMMEGMREMLGEDSDTLLHTPSFWKECKEKFLSVDDMLCHLEVYRMGIDRFQDDLETLSARDESWVNGNMRHPARIDSKEQHGARKASTCLMFQLAVFFRLWTHTKGQKLFDKKLKLTIPKGGIVLPKEGKRHDKVITAFINATFANEAIAQKMSDDDYHLLDKNASETSIRARLEKVDPRILLVPWKQESFDVMMIPANTFKKMAEHFAKRTQKTG